MQATKSKVSYGNGVGYVKMTHFTKKEALYCYELCEAENARGGGRLGGQAGVFLISLPISCLCLSTKRITVRAHATQAHISFYECDSSSSSHSARR